MIDDAPLDAAPMIVGLGASAGGLEAIQEFFDAVPDDTGAAFIVVQHLSPDFKSLMDEILKRHTGMQIVKVEKVESIEPNHVYLLPPRCNIRVVGQTLTIESQSHAESPPRPIDVFFESLAEQCGSRAIAIVLSGTGSDGARGAHAVKSAGGIVLVQDPTTCKFTGMPQATMSAAGADFVMSPGDLADKVTDLAAHPLLNRTHEVERAEEKDFEPFESIIKLLVERTGYPLDCYKRPTLVRRIGRRMGLRKMRTLEDYVAFLNRNFEELVTLGHECLIHVTRFYRDPAAFESLRQVLVSRFVENHGRNEPFRIWIAACSTGEEAYSTAGILERVRRDTGSSLEYKIFATDIDSKAIETAQAGIYPEVAELDIPSTDFDAIMIREPGRLKVRSSVRNRIVFTRHDLLRDPPFLRADLVICRNMLIYLKPEAQRIALEQLHYSLRRHGILMLGPSETVEPLLKDYVIVDAKWKIFSRKNEVRRSGDRDEDFLHLSPAPRSVVRSTGAPTVRPQDHPIVRACERLVAMFASAGVVVAASGEVIFTFGEAGRWLTIPVGTVTTNLADMLPPGLASAVTAALRRSRTIDAPVRLVDLPSKNPADDGVAIDVVHVPGNDALASFDILLIGRHPEVGGFPPSTAEIRLDDATRNLVDALERELSASRQSLQTTIEELESTNEELQSVNEELLSSNEELQATNQELHSVNEELYTVNAEHQQKIRQLTAVTDDLESVMASTAIGKIFLDDNLCIRRFTPSASIAVPIREHDCGRSILEIVNYLPGVALGDLVREVMASGRAHERRVVTENGAPILLRVHPISSDGSTSTVISLVDLSSVEAREGRRQESIDMTSLIESVSPDVRWVVDADTLRFRYVAPSASVAFGRPAEELLGDPSRWFEILHPDDRAHFEREFFGRMKDGTFDIEFRIVLPDGRQRIFHSRAFGAADAAPGGLRVVVGCAVDVTQRSALEQQRRVGSASHRVACEESPLPMLFLDAKGTILWANVATQFVLEQECARSGAALSASFEPEADRAAFADMLDSIARSGERRSVDVHIKGRDGIRLCRIEAAPVAIGDGAARFLVCQWSDLTSEHTSRRRLEKKARDLEEEAVRDPLTELLNRRGLERALSQTMALQARTDEPVVVVLIDCDCFKEINDRFGYPAGDAVLAEIAHRIRDCLRPTDVLARVGGDEFVAVLPATRLAEGAHVAEKIRRAVASGPIATDKTPVEATVSIGVAPANSSMTTVQDLLNAAGESLKNSKCLGRDRITFLGQKGGRVDLSKRGQAIDEILEGGARIVRQSIHRLDTEAVVGWELFVRGSDPLAMPEALFAAAQNLDLLESVDLACFERCIAAASRIDGETALHVNLFPTTLGKSAPALFSILDHVKQPRRICIELSERQFVGEASPLKKHIAELKSRGFKIAIDDVGFGRTALETLLTVEPDLIKIDRSLIGGIDQDAGKLRRLRRLIEAVRTLDVELIVEGIETDAEKAEVGKLGVKYAQGFLWSDPDRVAVEHGSEGVNG